MTSQFYSLPFDPHNCIVYAVAMRIKYGGRLIFRKSPRGWWFHFWWTMDGRELWEYTPINPRSDLMIPPLIYRGYVKQSRSL